MNDAFVSLIDRIWLSDSETDFQRILAEDENGKLVFEPAPRPVTWKRLKWASELATTSVAHMVQ